MIIDIILIVLFVFVMLYGYKKGCIEIVARLVSVIIAFILAYLLADTVGNYISQTTWGLKVEDSIETRLESVINNKDSEENREENTEKNILEMLPVSETKDKLSQKVLDYLFTGVGFVSVFVITRLILWVLKKILEGIFELPILKTFNKLGGLIASAVLYIIEISIILAIMKSISSMEFMTKPINMIQSSVITKQIYDHNIVTNIILSKII